MSKCQAGAQQRNYGVNKLLPLCPQTREKMRWENQLFYGLLKATPTQGRILSLSPKALALRHSKASSRCQFPALPQALRMCGKADVGRRNVESSTTVLRVANLVSGDDLRRGGLEEEKSSPFWSELTIQLLHRDAEQSDGHSSLGLSGDGGSQTLCLQPMSIVSMVF